MRSFFYSSYYFWVVSRAVLILLGLISLVSIFSMGRLNNIELLVNFSFIIYLIFHAIIFIREISKANQSRVLKIITGIYSIVVGLGIIIVITLFGSNKSSGNDLIAFIFSSWIVLLGLFDFVILNKKEIEPDDTEDTPTEI
jgi:uncharacterized membrane protein